MVAIFATYQSFHRICVAQETHGLPEASFVVADEAHRTAGKYDRDNPGPFQVVHHRLRAAKRLYPTATPRIYSKRSQLKISKMYQPAAIKALVVPNTTGSHWQRMREPLMRAYRATKNMVVPQYREPNAEVRCIWDRAVAKAAKVPQRTVDKWRQMMETDPFVMGTKSDV